MRTLCTPRCRCVSYAIKMRHKNKLLSHSYGLLVNTPGHSIQPNNVQFRRGHIKAAGAANQDS